MKKTFQSSIFLNILVVGGGSSASVRFRMLSILLSGDVPRDNLHMLKTKPKSLCAPSQHPWRNCSPPCLSVSTVDWFIYPTSPSGPLVLCRIPSTASQPRTITRLVLPLQPITLSENLVRDHHMAQQLCLLSRTTLPHQYFIIVWAPHDAGRHTTPRRRGRKGKSHSLSTRRMKIFLGVYKVCRRFINDYAKVVDYAKVADQLN